MVEDDRTRKCSEAAAAALSNNQDEHFRKQVGETFVCCQSQLPRFPVSRCRLQDGDMTE